MVSFFFWVLLLVVLGAGVLALGFAFLNYNQVMDVEIDAEHKERQSPFRFSMCSIQPGEVIEYCNNPEIKCTVVDDKTVSYQGQSYSLSSLAQLLTGSKYSVAGPRYFKYKGASSALSGSSFSCLTSCKRARTAAFYARTRFYLNFRAVQIASGQYRS